MSVVRIRSRHSEAMIHYQRSGSGPPVVLIHAGFLDHRMWTEMHQALSASYDVIRYDVRGAGGSSRDAVDHSPCDDLAALLDALGIEQAALVGVSMGARIAFELAVTRPERVRAAALCSLALPEFVTSDCDGMLPEFIAALTSGRVEAATALFTRMWLDGRREPSAVDPARRAAFVDLVDLTFAATFVHQKWRALAEIAPLERIQVPTLLLAGRCDWPDIHRTVTELGARMPNSHAVSIDAAAHMLPLDQPLEVLRHVRRFLEGHPGADRTEDA